MSEYEAAVERAQSRAAVLQSLQNSYGSKPQSSSHVPIKPQFGSNKKPVNETTTVGHIPEKGLIGDVVDTMLYAIGDQSTRTKQFFKDSLKGKAIVVENLKSQLEAAKASKKLERLNKRNRAISNKAMKRLRLCDPLVPSSTAEIRTLHNIWWEYAQQLVATCHSDAQLQARFQSMEKVGARAYVLESKSKAEVGAAGIITAVSKNCFYLSKDRASTSGRTCSNGGAAGSDVINPKSLQDNQNTASTTISNKKISTMASKSCVLQLVKEHCVLGLILPAVTGSHKKTHPSHNTNKVTSDSFNQAAERTLFTDETAPLESNSNIKNNTSIAASADDDAAVAASLDDPGKFDWNERTDAGCQMGVLYGKDFMPHCVRT